MGETTGFDRRLFCGFDLIVALGFCLLVLVLLLLLVGFVALVLVAFGVRDGVGEECASFSIFLEGGSAALGSGCLILLPAELVVIGG